MRIVNRIVGIEGVANLASPRVRMPINRRYHLLKFFTTVDGVDTAVTTVISRVRLFVNGKTIRDVSASNILAIAALNGLTPATGELPIMFSEPWRADKIDEQITAWDTFGETSFEVEFTLLDSGGVPGITGLAEYDFGQTLINGAVAKNIVKQFEQTKNATAGDNDFDNIVLQFPIQRIGLQTAAVVINSVEVTADDNKVYETTLAQNTAILRDHGLVGTAMRFPVVFDFTERIEDSLTVVKSMNLRFNAAAATAVTAVVEARAPGYL